MKYLFFFLLSISALTSAAQNNAALNINSISNWFEPTTQAEPVYGIKYQGVWGYHDAVTNKEYALLGADEGVYFIDVSNPASPQRLAFVQGRRDMTIWREIKTYSHYAYLVSDDAAPNSFQIVDLAYLPDSVHVVHDSDSIFARSHTIFVDGDKLYCGVVTGGAAVTSAMAVYSLANPELPQLLRKIEDDYQGLFQHVHDMFVRNDTIYASCGNHGLYVFRLKADNTFALLGSLTSYPDQGYNHSSALSADGKTLVFVDEVPAGMAAKVCDVSNLSDITVKSTFKSSEGATPHNPYFIGNNKVVIAYYQDGLQVFDVTNPSAPFRTGFYDTYPDNVGGFQTPAYKGCWGAYTDLPSGNILASDMQYGLFVLDINNALIQGVDENKINVNSLKIYPNPSSGILFIDVPANFSAPSGIMITDVMGRNIALPQHSFEFSGNRISVNAQSLSPAIYSVRLMGKNEELRATFVKVD